MDFQNISCWQAAGHEKMNAPQSTSNEYGHQTMNIFAK